MTPGWLGYLGIAALGAIVLVLGVTPFVWLPLLIIAAGGLFFLPLWAMITASADSRHSAAPREPEQQH